MSREIKFRVWDKRIVGFTKDRMDFMHLPDAKVIPIDKDGDLIWLQYTGLKDKNGVEVYEGDIMKLNDSDIVYVVEYQNNSFVLSSERADFKSKGYFTEREVIGNIYENKDLLK